MALSGWRDCTWGDIASLRYGRALKDYKGRTGPTAVFGTNGRIGATDQPAQSPGPGVIVGRKGAYRGVHYSPGPFHVIDTAFWLEPTIELDMRWAYYELLTHDINGLDSGSAIPSTSRESFYALPVSVPPIEEQRVIAGTLALLDEKVAANSAAASTAVQLAIVRLSSGDKRIRVGSVATISKGLSYKGAGLASAATPGAVPMYNLASFSMHGLAQPKTLKYYVGDFKASHQLQSGQLVIANTDLTQNREILGRGFIVPPRYAGAIHTHHTSVLRFGSVDAWISLWLWAQLQSAEFRGRAMGYATGTTVTALPPDAVLDYEVAVPAAGGQTEAQAASLLLDYCWQLELESETLHATRDALLFDLIRGRLTVKPTEVAA